MRKGIEAYAQGWVKFLSFVRKLLEFRDNFIEFSWFKMVKKTYIELVNGVFV